MAAQTENPSIAAFEQVEREYALLRFNPRRPHQAARTILQFLPGRLLRWRGDFHLWTGTHYRNLPQDELRGLILKVLEKARMDGDKEGPYPTTKMSISDIEAALAILNEVRLDNTIEPPWWLSEGTSSRLLSFQNCLVDEAGHQQEHDEDLFSISCAPYRFDPAATCPTWFAFLETLGLENDEVELLQEWAGYVLSTRTDQQKILLVIGPPRAGKGVLLRVFRELVGAGNTAAPTLHSLSTPFGLACLIGKRLATVSDARISGRADDQIIVERLLSISGEDCLSVQRKFAEDWTGQLCTRVVIASNELPRLSDASSAFLSRVLMLRLRRSFVGAEDVSLTDKLRLEVEGIAAWAMRGLGRLTERGHFIQPARSQGMLDDLRALSSPVSSFISERCVLDPEAWAYKDSVFDAWRQWCQEVGIHAGSKAALTKRLRAALPQLDEGRTRDDGRPRIFKGLGLK